MMLKFSRQIFVKSLSVKFNKTLPCMSRVVTFERRDGQTKRLINMKELIVGFRNRAKAPES
jgi:hypothetical protein